MPIRNAFDELATETTLQAVKVAAETEAAKPQALTDAQLRAAAVPVHVDNQPTGMATETTLAALKAVVDSLQTAALAIQTAAQALDSKTVAVDTGNVAVANFPATQAVSAAALPLPVGAATETTLAAMNAKLIAVNTGAIAGNVAVSNFPATQAVSAAALPLPAGAAADSTAQAIEQLNDTMLHALDRIFNNMPRLVSGRRLPISLVNGATDNEPSGPYYGLNTASVGDQYSGRLVLRMFEPWNFSDAGAIRLYQNIVVS